MSKSLLKLIAAASLALGLLAPAQATLLTFDDVPTQTLNSGTYQGFTWTNAVIVTGADYVGFQGIPQSVVSGTQSLINFQFGAISVGSATAFSLNSGYFTSIAGSGIPLTVTAYLYGNLVGTQTFAITNQAPTFLTFDQTLFGSVTQVSFNNFSGSESAGNALAFDDLTVNADAAGDVPEPASIALLGLGLLGLAAVRRRQKQH